MMNDGYNNVDYDGYMEQEEEWEREGLLDPAWEKQQKKKNTCEYLFQCSILSYSLKQDTTTHFSHTYLGINHLLFALNNLSSGRNHSCKNSHTGSTGGFSQYNGVQLIFSEQFAVLEVLISGSTLTYQTGNERETSSKQIVFNKWLTIIPLKGQTTGQNLFSSFKNIISSEKIPISKTVALTTDGAPAMVDRVKGLVRLCRKDDSFPQFVCYHCILHQQALCGHFLNLNKVMKLVVKIVNKIRAQALQRLFKTLADEVDCQYGELLLHSEVRRLRKISQSTLEAYDSKHHVEIVSKLKDDFKNRFKDFNEIEIVVQFVVSPFMEIDIQQFATSVTQNFSENIVATEMEVIACFKMV
ncbi:unnamed protein product [Acanthoscelides obtectus]|uniref:Uncharacterized protein n=1 Tax=Acanthoscelides obtectus TaxID=200917 RepID=A0A9P0MFI2_ACAOB|nr:unnamed protein product [Acanthoscelides obtectus]CAK1673503.1 General transcription factor II-I repeat domain-containing protein 2 [Acanthoscelides obtectus]